MKFVRDKAHCKYESYTKTEIDEMLPQKAYLKGDFAVLTYTIPAEYLIQDLNDSSLCNIGDKIELPSGFTEDNTVLVSKMYKYGDTKINNLSGYWTDKTDKVGITEVTFNKAIPTDGKNYLHFAFYDYIYSEDKPTNNDPIHLKFLVMKVA